MEYMKLRYVEIEPDKIYNWLDPFNVTAWCNIKPDNSVWWTDKKIEERKLFAKIWTEEFDKITSHFTKLKESIAKDGIKCPISCIGGQMRNAKGELCSIDHIPPEYWNHPEDCIYTQPFGGSRLTIAKELGIKKVPIVIHDYHNKFPTATEITRQNYKDYFGDTYSFYPQIPMIRLTKHLHLEGLYGSMNANTKEAQKAAAKIARERLGYRK